MGSLDGSGGEAGWVSRLVLVHLDGHPGSQPRSFSLGPEPRTIRRAQTDSTDIAIDHRSISRQPHASVRFDPNGYAVVQDHGRGTGTYVNGARLQGSAPVSPGALVRFGGVSCVVSAHPEDPVLGNDPLSDHESPSLQRARRLVERAAAGSMHVLLLGPTGAGKERLAERFHRSGGRPGPFVPVNCAGIPRDLLTAELFGHVAGAFSGASGAREGLWRRAHGGTLFLDEVAELAPEHQSAVLRALDGSRVRPVGADDEVEVDVRVVAATSRDVDALEAEGQLRSDLLGRLGGLRVRVPALKDRREEILPIFFAALGRSDLSLTAESAERLLLYPWPKNVRELVNAARVVQLFADEVARIGVEILPESVRKHAEVGPPTSATERTAGSGPPPKLALESLLRDHRGNVEQVARRLGVGRATVHRWLAKHSLSAARFRAR